MVAKSRVYGKQALHDEGHMPEDREAMQSLPTGTRSLPERSPHSDFIMNNSWHRDIIVLKCFCVFRAADTASSVSGKSCGGNSR
ncbi:hypothetical protein EAG_16245 [Camponotus floridanus]|uniref:Uncharacterized protein n=1 Tax=Camponotus floridanus TaxID=104421 RepID=E2AG73_CAMFO|nr:hypothetical protein EAG_16245 [Camponotus floridanus]